MSARETERDEMRRAKQTIARARLEATKEDCADKHRTLQDVERANFQLFASTARFCMASRSRSSEDKHLRKPVTTTRPSHVSLPAATPRLCAQAALPLRLAALLPSLTPFVVPSSSPFPPSLVLVH
eukprot:746239-Hanusia_phi.AAC.6